jgi:hypothetical protein
MSRVVSTRVADDGVAWLVFDPSPIERGRVDALLDESRAAVAAYVARHARAHILVDLTAVTWARVVHLYRITTAAQRERGADVFRRVPTAGVEVRLPARAPTLRWFVATCLARYASDKVRARTRVVA